MSVAAEAQETMAAADVAIIGAGPIGLFAVFALGQVGLTALLLDALPEIGGQCAALYPDKPIYDIPGRLSLSGGDLVRDLAAQGMQYKPVVLTGERVRAVEQSGHGFDIYMESGRSAAVRAVLLTAGAGALGPNRPPLENLEAYEGKSVFYHVADKSRFRGQRLVVAGGGDSALDWAIALAEDAASVTLVHRRPHFRGAAASVARLESLRTSGLVEVASPFQLQALEGKFGVLSAVTLRPLGAGEPKRIEADTLLAFFGLASDIGPIVNWDLSENGKTVTVDPTTMATRRSGIFAAGDIAAYPGKLKLILSGFSEAATAAYAIHAHLNPGRPLHFEFSTTKGVPGLAGTMA
jgi:thioredoxin reductase (NADPH)